MSVLSYVYFKRNVYLFGTRHLLAEGRILKLNEDRNINDDSYKTLIKRMTT